jgi:hypothetical protein
MQLVLEIEDSRLGRHTLSPPRLTLRDDFVERRMELAEERAHARSGLFAAHVARLVGAVAQQ